MKNIILILSFLVPTFANALVADRFKCDFEIVDENGRSTKKNEELYIARLPLSASPAPDVRMTVGEIASELSLDMEGEVLSSNLTFYYKHAVRVDSNGEPQEARQMVCMAMATGYCKKSSGMNLCSKGKVRCFDGFDPFDPRSGWEETTLFGGIPAFNERSLGGITSEIWDGQGHLKGVARFSCQFLGTFN